MEGQQLPLTEAGAQRPLVQPRGAFGPPVARLDTHLTAESSLATVIGAFHDHMVRQGYTENTMRSFISDLRILSRYMSPGRTIGTIGARDLEEFLAYLRYYRGKPCSPKSFARRVTTLKALFSWLTGDDVIARDPAASIVQEPVSSPLPQILYAGDIQRLLDTTYHLMVDVEDPDARPHALVSLLLRTAIKKGETMRIQLSHIDLSNPQGPVLYVRYSNPRWRHKERKLRLPGEFAGTLARYRERYHPAERLFECTARNLEYVLDDVAQRASLTQGISFEMLRWTAAVQDYQDGMEPDLLRQKLGLSEVTWRDTLKKLEVLAGPAL